MLCELSIKNFAIIDDLHINFSDGLTILSGETGAGKSIIINAVNLLLGSRASSKLVRTGCDTAELEALFHIPKKSNIEKILENLGHHTSDELLIRRVVSRNDRHKIYINGQIATMQILSSVAENLASISGQHAHQGLLKEDQHLLVLDQFGGLISQRNSVYDWYHKTLPLTQELKDLKALQNKQSDQIDLLTFQKNEIEKAQLTVGEDGELERERLRLKNTEMLFSTVNGALDELYNAEGAVNDRLNNIIKNFEKAAQIDQDLAEKSKAIENVSYQIEDITDGLRNYLQLINIDDKRLEDVEERIDLLNKLKRKYGGSLETVFEHLKSIEKNLSTIENLSDKISETENTLSETHQELEKLAIDLSCKRQKTAEKFAKKVAAELNTLRMPQTKFEVVLYTTASSENTDKALVTQGRMITETGIDRAVFMIAPNVGEELKPMAAIASGGELSRMILALKAIQAQTESVETVVFDEVDAGIGGGVAEVVGKKLAELSKYHQIICITHLAQIAKFGNRHFRIAKHVNNGRTKTSIEELNKQDRIDEIARMIGGEKITKKTIEHAREMLQTAD